MLPNRRPGFIPAEYFLLRRKKRVKKKKQTSPQHCPRRSDDRWIVPIAAFADGGGETSVAATSLPPAGEDGVITLTEDTTITTLTLNSTGKTVIDLNGHTLTYNSKLAIKIGDGQTLSFIDSSDSGAERGGTLALTGVTGASAAINPQKGGTVNAENINISCTGSAFFRKVKKLLLILIIVRSLQRLIVLQPTQVLKTTLA